MLKNLLSLIIFGFITFSVYADDDKLQFRGGVPQDLKASQVELKVTSAFLNTNTNKTLADLNKSFNYIDNENKNSKIPDELLFRGGGTSIYSSYASSVFLIYNEKIKSIGSGSLIDSDGLILTNYHVVDKASTVKVYSKPDGIDKTYKQVYEGQVVYVNKSKDLALVKVTGIPWSTKVFKIGEIRDVKIGEDVYAIGHPKGMFWSFTKGQVSQIRSKFACGKGCEATVVQTQTPINPGNSGGPLLDQDGKLVGVNTFQLKQSQNLNFAISGDDAKDFIKNKAQYVFKETSYDSSNSSTQSIKKISLTEKVLQKFPDSLAASSKKDGVIDMWYLKNSKTGKYDKAFVDIKRRGVVDGLLCDARGDGKWSVIYVDDEDIGHWTKVYIYNVYGTLTNIGYIYNSNNQVGHWERVG
jgi:S1-C subfamily serine protease